MRRFDYEMAPYKRKTDRQVVSAQQMEEAMKRLESGKSKREVARELGINECTLRKRLKNVRNSYNLCKISGCVVLYHIKV